MDRLRIALIVLFTVTLGAAYPCNADTLTGSVNSGAQVNYTFAPEVSGQALITLTWTTQASTLFLTTVCAAGGQNLPYGTAAGEIDRTARLEIGVLGGTQCVLVVGSLQGASSYQLNLVLTRSQSAAPAVRASLPLTLARPGSFLSDAADRAAETVRLLWRY